MPKEVPVFFLDANIIMYALGGPHLYREPCRKALAAVEADAIDVVTNVEVLQEILHRYRTLGDPERAEQVFQHARTLCEVVLPVRLRDMDLAVTLLRQFPSRPATRSTRPPCFTPGSGASSRPIAILTR